MKKTIATIAMLLMSGAAYAQTAQTFSAYVTGLAAASTPLSSSDVFYVNQGGNSRKITKNNLLTLGFTGFAVDSSGNASPLSVTTPYTAGVWTSGVGPAANISRLDRVLVGTSTQQNGAFGGSTTWAVTLVSGAGGNDGAQVSSISSIGGIGVFGAARTSDYGTLTGTPSAGTEGIYALGYQDDTTHVGSISEALLIEEFRKVGAAGIGIAAEVDIQNYGTVQVLTPYSGIVNNATLSLLVGSADRNTGTPTNASAAIYITNNFAAYNKGIIFAYSAVDSTVGVGGNGVAIEFADGQSIRWLESGLTTLGEIYTKSSTSGGVIFRTHMSLNAPAATESDFYFMQNDTKDFSLGDTAGHTFFLFNSQTGHSALQVNTAGLLSLGDNLNATIDTAGHLATPLATPASAAAACTAATIEWDASFIYVCTGSGLWKRVAIATWP